MVGSLERLCLPPGFKVDQNVRAYRDGVQLAEFDLRITGKIGSADYLCLIECRDRPSSGPADGAWIQQVGGRKAQFGANTSIAVSSTGFTPGAFAAARELNVELRELSKLNLDDPACLWARGGLVQFSDEYFNLDSVNLVVGETYEHDVALHQVVRANGLDTPFLMSSTSNSGVSLLQVAVRMFKEQDLWSSKHEPNGETHAVPLHVRYPEPESRFFVRTDAGPIYVSDIIFHSTQSHTQYTLPLAEVRTYSSAESGAVGQVASYGPIELLHGRRVIVDVVRNAETGRLQGTARYL